MRTLAISLASSALLVAACTALATACSAPSNTLFSSSGIANGNPNLPAAGSPSGGTDSASGGASGGDPSPGGGAVDQGGMSDSAGAPSAGSAAGGMPAAGGPSAAGSGGTAGAPSPPAPPSVCDSKLSVPKALIDDFEDGVAGWSAYIGNDPWHVDSTQPGADNTDHALRFSGGHADTSGFYHLMPCSDVSSFDGIQFWAKGRGGDQIRFLAVIPATDPTDGIGDCKATCSDHPGLQVTLGNQWELHRIAFSDLKQYGFGTKAAFNSVINAVLWINDGPVPDFDFSIDEVKLYKAATDQ